MGDVYSQSAITDSRIDGRRVSDWRTANRRKGEVYLREDLSKAGEVHLAARRLAMSEERVRSPSLALMYWMRWAVWWAHLTVNQALRPWRFDSSRIHEACSLKTEEWISSKKYAGPSSRGPALRARS